MTRSFAPLLVVAAAFVFGGAVVLGFAALDDGLARVLVAVAVVAVGAGVAFLPDADVVTVGTGLVAFGAGLFGSTATTDALRYGLPALVLLALAATGPRIWLSGAGVLIALALPDSLVLAAVLTLVVVFADERAWWGDLAGAAAGVALLAQPSVVAAASAAVLLMIAAVRRDLVTGLLAAAVLVVPAPAHAWPLAVVVVVALVAIRVPRVRTTVTRLPALRGTRPAHAAAGAAVVAAGGLVAIALQLPYGWLVIVTVLVAGALGHWLPAPAGPALAVVALVGLGAGHVAGLLALLALPLLLRHPTPPVFAAAAFLALRVSPLDPLVSVLVIGAVAVVFAFWRKTAPAGQAVGAVALGAVALADVRPEVVVLVLVMALAVSTGWRPSAPLVVAAAFAMYLAVPLVATGGAADGGVVAALLVAAAALVVAAVFTARRHASGGRLVHRA
ncbi:hypothetical protein [Actinophytocola algeriensis]|uniref:Uncharacterized protein n=1 Tax=Actinophytocola algeriensis TaxID=1768010 RepID=A0A7W7VJD8_9PSEU|nr:hypothetical protein [Actinophytocola algeriensis]MBB4912451.1 hypothetical protein [Actinophytocola algeriensis]MBE1480976.1 hypothetical protein [Actinophytocola algeriensis]